jgi:carboxyl-terminal processing protease
VFLVGLWVGWWIHGDSSLLSLNAFVERSSHLGASANQLLVFERVWRMISSEYVAQPVSGETLIEGATAGLVAALNDPYSVYFNAEAAKEFKSEIQGNFEGIGAEVGLKEDQLVIIAPLPGSPAELAGLRSGDEILAIDGTQTNGLLLDEAVDRLRGQKGTTVTILARTDDQAERTVVVTRDVIQVRSVTVSRAPLRDGSDQSVGVIEIAHFTDTTLGELREGVNDLLVNPPSGLILDLRNNPGGYLQSAVDVGGLFLPQNSPVLLEERRGKRETLSTNGKGELADLPMVILINNGTASAAEILAGALRDDRQIILVGETTFGKGSVQDFLDLDNGGSLKLTVARWFTPSGQSIDQTGLKPDIDVAAPTDQSDQDPQYDRALEELRTRISAP